jgi:diacylglycerol kinase (ATP)
MKWILSIFRSFQYAFKGILILFSERNFIVHCIATIVVILAGLFYSITKTEWLIIVLCIASVLCAEAFNSALERLCNHLHPELHENIRKVKDIAAGAVLIVALAAAVIGAMIFVPYMVL